MTYRALPRWYTGVVLALGAVQPDSSRETVHTGSAESARQARQARETEQAMIVSPAAMGSSSSAQGAGEVPPSARSMTVEPWTTRPSPHSMNSGRSPGVVPRDRSAVVDHASDRPSSSIV